MLMLDELKKLGNHANLKDLKNSQLSGRIACACGCVVSENQALVFTKQVINANDLLSEACRQLLVGFLHNKNTCHHKIY